ncbi:hypothetical protein ACFE04_025880 [Oxalis oulophora]
MGLLLSVLPLIIVTFLLLYEDWVSTPSCKLKRRQTQFNATPPPQPEDLKVMIVANLLLLGSSEHSLLNLYFRDYYLSKFFRKSYASLKPDMLLVLGDVSAKGSELTKSERLYVVDQFHEILGPLLSLPFHVVVGDRDVGHCDRIDSKSMYWLSNNFPGLDSVGCGAFEISNVSFVSLNSVSLLCGDNKLRFSVEKVIERESVYMQSQGDSESSGFGPVLLLHFPLHRPAYANCGVDNALQDQPRRSFTLENGRVYGAGPYELEHTVPPNATEYIFQALKPRIIFSAHTHEFCDYTHSDGTREVTVPAVTWKVRDDPGFVVASFQRNSVSVSYCSLPRESFVLAVYASVLLILILTMLIANSPKLTSLR